jgi:hypothetical protein
MILDDNLNRRKNWKQPFTTTLDEVKAEKP